MSKQGQEPKRMTAEQWRHHFSTPGIQLTAEELTASGVSTLLRAGTVAEWEQTIRQQGASINIMDVIALASMMSDLRLSKIEKTLEDLRSRIHLLDMWLEQTASDKGYRDARALRTLAAWEGEDDARRNSGATEGTNGTSRAIQRS